MLHGELLQITVVALPCSLVVLTHSKGSKASIGMLILMMFKS